MKSPLDRRQFLAGTTAAGVGVSLGSVSISRAQDSDRLALHGGTPVRTADSPSFPIFGESEEQGLLEALRSGTWIRASGKIVKRFEESFAEKMGAKYCLATSSGTGALLTALTALDVQAGDEVILPPYTFVACANVILMRGALPVFVDIDPETFQLDVSRVEDALTERTRCLMPVHIGGAPVEMDALRAVAEKHRLPIVEDACQAHGGQWNGQLLGTLAEAGCFSFQASKNINCGEGGAILFQDRDLYERCVAFHANGRRPANARGSELGYQAGFKLTMTEFQGGVISAQLDRLEPLAQQRDENAKYLTELLEDIPGIEPARQYSGCTRNAWHLFMMRYHSEHFENASRARFLRALSAEGVPTSSGYRPLNKEPYVAETLKSRGFRRLFSDERLAEWREKNQCPANDQLCEEAFWLTQRYLLGTRQDMEQIAEAIRKVQRHAAELGRT
jgi:perosamine synthetase